MSVALIFQLFSYKQHSETQQITRAILWLRPYFTVYPSSRPNTDTVRHPFLMTIGPHSTAWAVVMHSPSSLSRKYEAIMKPLWQLCLIVGFLPDWPLTPVSPGPATSLCIVSPKLWICFYKNAIRLFVGYIKVILDPSALYNAPRKGGPLPQVVPPSVPPVYNLCLVSPLS